jgi:hypothetical protein
MAVFYVLPPRAALGEALARFLRPYLPGLALSVEACTDLIGVLTEAQPAYVMHREDLAGDDVYSALRDGCGAEPDDRVVLVSMGSRPNEPDVRIRRVADGPAVGPVVSL